MNKFPEYITLESVVGAIDLAIEEHRLAAIERADDCMYVYNTNPRLGCAIGVALSEELRNDLIRSDKNTSLIKYLKNNRIMIFLLMIKFILNNFNLHMMII